MKNAFLLTALAGLFLGASAPPRGWYALAYVGLFLWMLGLQSIPRDRGGKTWFLVGWVVTSTINAVVLAWSVGLMVQFADFPWILAFLISVLLWTSQGLVGAFASLFAYALVRKGMRISFALVLTVPLAVRLTPAIFPWPFATSQLELLPFVQWAEWGGTTLLDVLLVLITALAFEAVNARNVRFAHASIALLLTVLGVGAWRIARVEQARNIATPIRVGVAQPNISIHDKHDPRMALPNLHRLRNLTRRLEEEGTDVIVWPESAYPFRLPHDLRHEPDGPYSIHGQGIAGPLLIGSLSVARSGEAYNSVFSFAQDGRVLGVSDKVELLAFGEYIPLWDWLPPLQHYFPSRGFDAGKEALALPAGASRVGVLNCYEDVLDQHARHVAQRNPSWLVNVTNDAWFGDTDEPHLHNAVARFRSIETRRDLVRVVNTGVSAHITATGAMAHATPTYQERAFVAQVRPLQTQTLWTLFGDWLMPLLAGTWIALTIGARNRAA